MEILFFFLSFRKCDLKNEISPSCSSYSAVKIRCKCCGRIIFLRAIKFGSSNFM